MSRTIKPVLLLLATMLLALTAACGSSSGKEELTTVKFSEVIRSIFYAPHYVAMSQGFFKEQGLNVDMNTAQGSDKGAAALIAGTADVSMVGPETTIYIYNQKGDKTLKVFHQLTAKDGSFLLSREKIENFAWSDLAGKTVIGWRPGSSPQMVLNSMLLKEQVSGVNVVTNIASTAMAGAFTSGQGDFIQVFEPIASTLVNEGKAYYVTSLGEDFGAYPETSYVATSDYIKAHPDVLKKFTAAVAEGAKWLNTASDDEIAKALRPFFEGTPDDLILQSVNRYKAQGTWPTDPELTQDQFDILQNVLVENGVLKAEDKVTKMDDIVDMSFVRQLGKSD
ncbi:ABC transporter substrate-binding protein [Paenibacillus glycinis]|uniref:ABC transporter substrate-binding protein n=1 Tax=Paenibacillus glycinis TaxID=2697035 RepID=A0ABW9XLP6_9BACL|nr:ABC transporter substrate-binding protein [Paenibacillus glycinis]NBD23529.1 ABC transporter substrate-binding protein [Paenibacillus glycinis]